MSRVTIAGSKRRDARNSGSKVGTAVEGNICNGNEFLSSAQLIVVPSLAGLPASGLSLVRILNDAQN